MYYKRTLNAMCSTIYLHCTTEFIQQSSTVLYYVMCTVWSCILFAKYVQVILEKFSHCVYIANSTTSNLFTRYTYLLYKIIT